jgi:hypothetical protein
MLRARFAVALLPFLVGCMTTRIELGAEPGGEIEKDTFRPGMIGGTPPVDLSKHCGGKVAAVTLDRGMFGDTVTMDCAGSGGAAATPASAPDHQPAKAATGRGGAVKKKPIPAKKK